MSPHPSVASRQPQPPAAAYDLLAPMLPAGYFTQPPPRRGVIVHVRGRDGIWTRWAMPEGLSVAVVRALAPFPVEVRTETYLLEANA